MSAPVAFRAAAEAIVGGRSEQQDAVALEGLADGTLLVVLADGMGGYAGGAVAARAVVGAVSRSFPPAYAAGGAGYALLVALNAANDAVAAAKSADPVLSKMGATLVAAHVCASGVSWVSVGDSPMWLIRGGVPSRLNEDHSLRGEDAERLGRSRNSLLSVVAGAELDMVDLRSEPIPVRDGDWLVVASDGILSLTEEAVARAVAGAAGPEEAAAAAVDAVAALRLPRQDNCTVAMVGFVSEAVLPRSVTGRRPSDLPALAAWAAAGVALGLLLGAAILAALG